MPSWTELNTTFVPVGTGWQNYDIFTNKSVPKGAIAHIIITNSNIGADATIGLRTDGSSLDRYILLHEAEGGGVTTAEFWVKVDATTGLIETYCNSVTGLSFILDGYLTGVDFTELWQDISPTLSTTWQERNVNSLYGVPLGRVCTCMMCNRDTSATANVGEQANTLGVRTDGSSLVRSISVHEAEGGLNSTTVYSMAVKSDASTGIIEVYAELYTAAYIYLGGYFGSELDYVEKDMIAYVFSLVGWNDWNLTSELDIPSRLCEITCMHNTQNAERFVGARENTQTTGNRYIEEHEAESNGYAGYSIPTKTDADGILEVYSETTTNAYIVLVGYFKWAEATTYSINNLVQSNGLANSSFNSILKILNIETSNTQVNLDSRSVYSIFLEKVSGGLSSISLIGAYYVLLIENALVSTENRISNIFSLLFTKNNSSDTILKVQSIFQIFLEKISSSVTSTIYQALLFVRLIEDVLSSTEYKIGNTFNLYLEKISNSDTLVNLANILNIIVEKVLNTVTQIYITLGELPPTTYYILQEVFSTSETINSLRSTFSTSLEELINSSTSLKLQTIFSILKEDVGNAITVLSNQLTYLIRIIEDASSSTINSLRNTFITMFPTTVNSLEEARTQGIFSIRNSNASQGSTILETVAKVLITLVFEAISNASSSVRQSGIFNLFHDIQSRVSKTLYTFPEVIEEIISIVPELPRLAPILVLRIKTFARYYITKSLFERFRALFSTRKRLFSFRLFKLTMKRTLLNSYDAQYTLTKRMSLTQTLSTSVTKQLVHLLSMDIPVMNEFNRLLTVRLNIKPMSKKKEVTEKEILDELIKLLYKEGLM